MWSCLGRENERGEISRGGGGPPFDGLNLSYGLVFLRLMVRVIWLNFVQFGPIRDIDVAGREMALFGCFDCCRDTSAWAHITWKLVQWHEGIILCESLHTWSPLGNKKIWILWPFLSC